MGQRPNGATLGRGHTLQVCCCFYLTSVSFPFKNILYKKRKKENERKKKEKKRKKDRNRDGGGGRRGSKKNEKTNFILTWTQHPTMSLPAPNLASVVSSLI